MKYEVKKPFWHGNRPVAVGEQLDLDPAGARWLLAQGKVSPVGEEDTSRASGSMDQESKGRRGRKTSARQNHVPENPAAEKGDEQ